MDMETITAEQFGAAPGVEDWRADESGAVAEFSTGDFATGARLFAAIADLAEKAGHHPDVDVRYPSVRVTLITHSAGGLTIKDAALAAQISSAARELGIAAESPSRSSEAKG